MANIKTKNKSQKVVNITPEKQLKRWNWNRPHATGKIDMADSQGLDEKHHLRLSRSSAQPHMPVVQGSFTGGS